MGKFLYISAPELCQGEDQNLMVQMAEIIFPGFVIQDKSKNGLELCLSGDFRDQNLRTEALKTFQLLLGILRAWNPSAGKRCDETNQGLGLAIARDENGNQASPIGYAQEYINPRYPVDQYSRWAARAVKSSSSIRNAFWINGRRDRTSADYYMIFEYAKKELGGENNMKYLFGISQSEIVELRKAANNLCPTLGGRHAPGNQSIVTWGLKEQNIFISTLLSKWIEHNANSSSM